MKRPSGVVGQPPRPRQSAAPAAATPPKQKPGQERSRPEASVPAVAPSLGSIWAPAAPADTSVPAPEPEKAPDTTPAAGAETPGLGDRLAELSSVRQAVRERKKVERREARRFTKRSRRRRLAWLIGTGFVVVVLGGAVGSAYSPLMQLRHIEVVGTQRLKASDVETALDGQLGKPLPLVSQQAVKHALDDFRLIRSYSTEMRPPSTMIVRVSERTPIGVVKIGSAYELVDQAGVVISSTSKPPAGFPLVALASTDAAPQGSADFAASAAVLASLPQTVLKQVTGASATSANDVTLTMAGGKSVVWGGTGQTTLKAATLAALLKGAPQARVYDVSAPESPVTR